MKVDGLELRFLLRATGGTLRGERKNITGISIDSRTIKKGEVFFALKGENYDGHSFCKDAVKKGASYLVVEKDAGRFDNVIKVKNTIEALGSLAKMWRRRFNIKCVAITGTSGKTTTRSIITQLLKRRYNCVESEKNYNNLIGLPLSIFKISKKTQVGVFELATNKKGEIKKLSDIAMPDIAVLTNIGRGHLEFFDFLVKLKSRLKSEVFSFGIKHTADFTATDIKIYKNGLSFFVNDWGPFYVPLIGMVNIYNSLAAITTASIFGMDSRAIKRALRLLKPETLRLNRIVYDGVTVYNDSYNANPDSMAAVLAAVEIEKDKRKIACIGDMLELGRKSAMFHRELGKQLVSQGFSIVFL
ncbi:MAG: hypothetical protein B5M53_07095, partial [Candidatus Cloacimonas sp. 4484_209]